MLRLSKKADYALMAMKHLAIDSHSGHASAGAIAERYAIPVELLAKILQRLVRKGLLQSRYGMRGGYELARNPSAISVLEVIQAIDGPFRFTACSATERHCAQFRSCSVRDPLWQIRERMVQSLRTFTIFDLAAGAMSLPNSSRQGAKK